MQIAFQNLTFKDFTLLQLESVSSEGQKTVNKENNSIPHVCFYCTLHTLL